MAVDDFLWQLVPPWDYPGGEKPPPHIQPTVLSLEHSIMPSCRGIRANGKHIFRSYAAEAFQYSESLYEIAPHPSPF